MGDVSLVAAMFQLGDVNQDGNLTKAEIYEYFKTVTNSFSAYIRAERFMNVGDINGDGYLTQTGDSVFYIYVIFTGFFGVRKNSTLKFKRSY